jgi:hypothetical protein
MKMEAFTLHRNVGSYIAVDKKTLNCTDLFSFIKTNRIMLLRKIIAVYFEILTKDRIHSWAKCSDSERLSRGFVWLSRCFKGLNSRRNLSCSATEQNVRRSVAANATFFLRSREHKNQFPISATFPHERELSSYQID